MRVRGWWFDDWWWFMVAVVVEMVAAMAMAATMAVVCVRVCICEAVGGHAEKLREIGVRGACVRGHTRARACGLEGCRAGRAGLLSTYPRAHEIMT